MLELLAMRQGHTITKEMFSNQLYGGMDEPEQSIHPVRAAVSQRDGT